MAYISKQGQSYPSSFDRMIHEVLLARLDIHSQSSIIEVRRMIKSSLESRYREEDSTAKDSYFAGRRISGSIADLEEIREAMVSQDARPDAIVIVDDILSEARRAHENAPKELERSIQPITIQALPAVSWAPQRMGGTYRDPQAPTVTCIDAEDLL